jgi:hypothetical protein
MGMGESMSVLLVSYDLNRPGQNYTGLYKELERWTRCRALESTWFLDTPDDPAAVRNALYKHIDTGDQLYVFRLRKHWAAHKQDGCTEWLKDTGRSWD